MLCARLVWLGVFAPIWAALRDASEIFGDKSARARVGFDSFLCQVAFPGLGGSVSRARGGLLGVWNECGLSGVSCFVIMFGGGDEGDSWGGGAYAACLRVRP